MTQQNHQPLAFIYEASHGLPGSIKQVADFLLAEGTGIEQLTMGQVAARAYTSKPTLVRFAKQAGYSGWKDFRRAFLQAAEELEAQQAQEREVDVNTPFGLGAPSADVIENLARIQELAVSEVRRSLNQKALDGAAQAIVDARDVAHFSVMQNYHRGKIFASNLSLTGILCRTPRADDESGAVANRLGPGDCAIVTSYSGGLEHVPMVFVPKLKERGVTIVAVTNSEHSPLGDIADYALTYRPLEHFHAKIAAFYSGACTSLILDILYASCFARRFEEGRASKEAIIEGMRNIVPEDFGHMKDG